MKLNPYQKFLIDHRIYCEKCSVMTLTPSTHVIRENGHDLAVCEGHFADAHPIEAGYERKVEIYYKSKTQER